PLAQTAQVRVDLGRFLAELLGPVGRLGQCVLLVGQGRLSRLAGRADLPPALDELLAAIDWVQVRRGEQVRELLGLRDPYRAGLLAVGELAIDLGEPVAAVAGQLDPERGFRLPQLGKTVAEAVAQSSKATFFC